jgi:hypothetical protein
MPTKKLTLRFGLLAASLWLAAISSAFAQTFENIPPNSVIGNVLGQSGPSYTVTFPQLAAQLVRTGIVVQGPTSSTPGHAAIFGSIPNSIVDGGAISGTGTVTAVTCGAGLNGGTFNVSGTCSVNMTIAPQLRVTLTSATPVMTASVAGATTVLVTPYHGNMVLIYDGTNMLPTAFSEVSQATTDTTKSPAAVAASSVYDIFCWVDSAINRCTRGPAWSNSTTRGYTLTMVNGILLNTSSITNGPAALRGTYLGTIASNGSSTIDFILGAAASGGTAAVLNVWNAYNRVIVGTTVTDSGAPYTYTSSAIRQARASAGMEVTFVTGLAEDAWDANGNGEMSLATGSGVVSYGIGLDGVNAYASPRATGFNPATSMVVAPNTFYSTTSIGQHVVSLNQAGDNTHANTFDNNSTDSLSFRLRM